MSDAQHLYEQRGWGKSLCGSYDDPVDIVSLETFNLQLGLATGKELTWGDDFTMRNRLDCEAGICAACVSKFIAGEIKQ